MDTSDSCPSSFYSGSATLNGPMPFKYEPTFQLAKDDTQYRLLTKDGVSTVDLAGRTYLKVEPSALATAAKQAFNDINFFFRSKHLKKLGEEVLDPEASDNDRFVIYTHLQNA